MENIYIGMGHVLQRVLTQQEMKVGIIFVMLVHKAIGATKIPAAYQPAN